MPLVQPIVPARYVTGLLDVLEKSTSTEALHALLWAHQFDPYALREPHTILSIGEFDALIQVLSAYVGREDLGFDLGLTLTLESHAALGLAMASCHNVLSMVSLACRFTRLMSSSFTLTLARHDNHHEMVWRPAAGMSNLALHSFYELHVTSLYHLLETVLGSMDYSYDVWIPMARPVHVHRYLSLARLKPHFELSPLPEVRTLLPNKLLMQPLHVVRPSDVPDVVDLARMQRQISRQANWTEWVTLMLREAEHYQPTQEHLAALMNVSAHTLARKLREEGASYRDLANHVRHSKAKQLLTTSTLALEVIAYRLGYDQLSNFSHAFKRLEGVSPRAFRQSLSLS